MLILAATPIGNLEDASPRLQRLLAEVDHLFAEDTRVSRKLLNHFHIKRTLAPFHEHSDEYALNKIAELLEKGEDILYITDGGMPGISDPGYELVRQALELGVDVDVIPGPCALINALVLSGLPSHTFVFMGFFPTRQEKREALTARLTELQMTAIFYEAPTRIRHCLEFLASQIPDTPMAVCRELTKRHQEVIRGTASEILATLNVLKGEMVLVIGEVEILQEQGDIHERYQALIAKGHSPSKSVKTLSASLRISKREVYKMIHGEN